MAAVEHKFKKQSGTSGISGQLYETKLLSLILFKLLHDDDIPEFYLGSNMDEVGAFDDICLKAKIKGINKRILVFIQAKHKDDESKHLNYDLIKNFHTSLVKVQENFKSTKQKNILFNDNYDDIECLFILYTNSKYFIDPNTVEVDVATSSAVPIIDTRRYYKNEFANKLNYLIATNEGSKGCHLNYNDADLEYVGEKILDEEIAIVVEHFAKFLNDNDKQSMNIMQDEYMSRYHVVLRQSVVDVSEIQSQTQGQKNESESKKPQAVQKTGEDWRYVTFQPAFFETEDFVITRLRNKIYEFLLKNRGNSKKSTKTVLTTTENLSEVNIDQLVSSFLREPSAINLSYLVDTYITYTNGKLKFLVDRPNTEQATLEQMEILPQIVDEAQLLNVINYLKNLKIKVPISFGNLDMTLKGNQKKVDKRLDRLTSFIVELCQRYECESSHLIVTIGEDIDDDYLSSVGGIGGAVGNLFLYDNANKYMKFSEDSTLLHKNSKSFFDQLNRKITNLSSYRFKIKTMNFPKLVFDCTDEAKVILDKLLVYEKQSNQSGVEKILINQIKEYEESNTTQALPTKLETIAVSYHHEIQQWWLIPKWGKYLTKSTDIYQTAIKNIIAEPQMCALQSTYFGNMQYRSYVFNENATNAFNSINTFSNTIVITDVASLMVMKVIQWLQTKDVNNYVVLDLKYILNLPIKDFRALNVELSDTQKVIIIVCDGVENSGTFYKRLLTVSQAVEEKEIIVVANKDFVTTIDLDELKEYFAQINNVLEDEKIILTDLVLESQKNITENAKVIFQGQETYLKSIMEEDSLVFVKGLVLNKIIRDETLIIGESLIDTKYEDIKHLYVDRRIKIPLKSNSFIYVTTFNDIEQHFVLITAQPGMGKSILLTHLSLKTKELYNNIWIMRINLIDQSKELYNWQNGKFVINTLEVMKFLCRILVKNKNISVCLKEVNDKIYLENCSGDELLTFELNIFLQFYNNGKLLLLFDGFDEICPHYKDNVLKLFKVVINSPQRIKMWVTTRPYNEILPDLERVMGNSYKLQYITDGEQENYLNQIWRSKLALEKLNETQVNNLRSFSESILDKLITKTFPVSMHFTFWRMYVLFYNFIQSLFNKDGIILPYTLQTIDTIEPVASTSSSDNNISFSKLVDQLVGTPLLLFLVAEYFLNISTNLGIKEWELDINITKIYESFYDTKLRNILFEEKNKVDVYKPDIMTRYDKDRDECIVMHKRLAAHTFLKNKIFFEECPLVEFEDIQPFKDKLEFEIMINKIESGTEKTGIIDHVSLDDEPVFIHKTFGEYFASEFLCDIFKSSFDFDKKKLLYTALYTYGSMDIRPWFNEKRWVDKDLNIVIQNILSKKLVVLSWHREFFSRGDWGTEHLLKLLSSCSEDYEEDWLSNTTEDFADTLNVLDPQERRLQIRRFQTYVIAKMKPHLKQHFTGTLVLRGYRQMINWMKCKIDLM